MTIFEAQWKRLSEDCKQSDPHERAIWLRRVGRARGMHGGLLDSAILDELEKPFDRDWP